jgi:hypothetical protein
LSILTTFVRHPRHPGKVKEHPKDIGDRTTLMVIHALQRQGKAVYLPFGENTRCDIVTDDGETLSRVQCKTGRLRNGVVSFRPCSTYAHHPNPKITRRSYIGEIDEFGVYCPETRGIYLIPIGDVAATTEASLRVDPVRNGQSKHVRWAARYAIGFIDVQLS